MRRRVYRLYQPITIVGLELWQLPVIGLGFVIGLRLMEGVHPAAGLLTGAVTGYLALMLAEKLRERYPGASLLQEALWLTQSDRYTPGKDQETTPLSIRHDRE
ncbi:hypothetical protein [Meiothermus sp. Pnk-1]|uniref:hypothetical protein n=1 Tax=Meiothermus sp. Pnk-1 TaxID=873128 RepID=UPI000D7D0B96|nr:hypothetical protein [Meiothermus sp. Pnk-1]PZA07421.1 hypothetical protein DNA98_07265 [Meiothermus sp. Pnk-1]